MPLTKRNITLIDGYNVINAWPKLKDISNSSLEAARDALIDEMAEYKSLSGEEVILVFDAYNQDRLKETIIEKLGITIVFTKKFQTADTYIEKEINRIGREHNLKVVTDDGLIQVQAAAKGASRITALELNSELNDSRVKIKRRRKKEFNRNFKSFPLSQELLDKIEDMKEDLEN